MTISKPHICHLSTYWVREIDNCILSVGVVVGLTIIYIPLDKLANREYSVSDNRGELVRVNKPIKPKTSLLLSRVSGLLAEQNIQAYVVGGFVRDLLLVRRQWGDPDPEGIW